MKLLIQRLRRRIAITATLTALAAAALVGFGAGPASAAGHNVGVDGNESRCLNSIYYDCLYYDASSISTTPWWGTNAAKVNDLGTTKFFSSTHLVKNDAGAIACYFLQCRSYVNENQSGDYDYLGSGQHGKLYYTWNNEASLGASNSA